MPSSQSPPFGDDRRGDQDQQQQQDDSLDADYSIISNYPEEDDYYALLSLPRNPSPTDAEIRSAYRTLTLAFHPDKQPAHLRNVAEQHFDRIQTAYETLIDSKKRVVYDLLGADGVRAEWSHGGLMGRNGSAEKQVGIRAKTPEEFRKWFLGMMKRRERTIVNSMVQSRAHVTLGIDASNTVYVTEDGEDVVFNIPEPQFSSYEVGSSFKVPLPSWKALFGDAEDEEEKEGEDSQETSESTDMAINASISGDLRQVVQTFEIQYEDGSVEDRQLPMPSVLTTKNVKLGAGVSHAFGDVASSKGILGKRPFSLLSYSAVSATALVLPTPTIQTGYSKYFMPIPGTRPIRVDLSTTFIRSPLNAPPMINLQVLKGVAQRKFVFCHWNSGTIFWPDIIQRIFSPFVDLSMNVDSLLSIPQSLSQLQVGFYTQPPQPKHIISLDDEEGEHEDPEVEEIRHRDREISKTAESWHAQVAASPVGGGLTLSYSRNIFSGTTANDPLRSEWSYEGHYPLAPAGEPRAVRLQVEGTLGFDLSLTWAIEGLRQVGEFTRMGLGIGIQERGLAVTVSWSRLAQKITLPIIVCPSDVVNADAAALTVIFSWMAYCACEFGYIRPRDRKKRRRVIARRQRELKKAIPKKRDESLQTIELMAEQVQRRQAREEAQGGLVITKAEYAYDPSSKKKAKANPAEFEIADVTIPVAAMVDRSQLVIPRDMAKFKFLGFYDPAPLLPKKLKIWYTYHEKEHYVEAIDSEGIACPMRLHMLLG